VTTHRFTWRDRDTAALDLIELAKHGPEVISLSALQALEAIRSEGIAADLESIALDSERTYWERAHALRAYAAIRADIYSPQFVPLARATVAAYGHGKDADWFDRAHFLLDVLGVIDGHPSNRDWFFGILEQGKPAFVRTFLRESLYYRHSRELQSVLLSHLVSWLERHPNLLDIKSAAAIRNQDDETAELWLNDRIGIIVQRCLRTEPDDMGLHVLFRSWPELKARVVEKDSRYAQTPVWPWSSKRIRRYEPGAYQSSPIWQQLVSIYTQAASGDEKALGRLSGIARRYRANIPIKAVATHFLGKLRDHDGVVGQLCLLMRYANDKWGHEDDPDEPIRFEAGEALRDTASSDAWYALVSAFFLQPPNRLQPFLVAWLAYLTDDLS
jgi:hypothetical protein